MGQVEGHDSASGGAGLKVLHLLCDGPIETADRVIALQSQTNRVKVVDLSNESLSYAELVDEIFAHDKVISW